MAPTPPKPAPPKLPPAKPAPPRSLPLAYITAQFYTTSDDKDADTQVLINVRPAGPPGVQTANLASYSGNLGGHLQNDSTSEWVTLSFNSDSNWIAGAEYILNVLIIPNGHDTWRFTCYLSFSFRDNTSRTFTFENHALSQDVRSNDYSFIL